MFIKRSKWYVFKFKCTISYLVGLILYPKILRGVKLMGLPEIETYDEGSIKIDKSVTLNSMNKYYHVSMFAPVKLVSNTVDSIIRIGCNTRIHGFCIHAKKSITIGDNVLIAANCQIFDSVGHLVDIELPENRIHSVSEAKEIIIGDNCWIGTGCIILPGVTIGDGAVIGAGSIVTKNIPQNSLSAGNPAKVIRILNSNRI
jgi:acetyltransferase-like isoleucine patch superfamily enzyme